MVFFKQFYLGCLAQASYLIGSQGEAVVVDPQRDVELYLDEARRQQLTIRHVIETHLHADFVSGHVELAKRTGAKIYVGKKAGAEFPHVGVEDGLEIVLGDIRLKFLETPGHTPESISILIFDPATAKDPQKVLTGDTLFIGDVGRPDLVGSKGLTPEAMAGMLYDSLWEKILPLPDAVEVYPAHGAGSACGRNISKETSSTLGVERRTNYALQKMTRDEFIRLTTNDLPAAPGYFAHDAEANRRGAAPLGELQPPAAKTPKEIEAELKKGSVLLDVRDYRNFGNGHVPGSINLGLSGMFAPWAGTLLGPSSRIFLVADDAEQVTEAAMRLARVGLEQTMGFLDGGLAAWDRAGLPVARLSNWPVDELQAQLKERKDLQLIDVRRPGEFSGAHVSGALSLPLNTLEKRIAELDPNRPTAIICGSGYRSSAAASLLLQRNFRELYNVIGGMNAWTTCGLPKEKNDENG